MLFLFGTRATRIHRKVLEDNTECVNCNNQNTLIATTYSRYFHIFWIPFLPVGKTTILECSHCKKSYAESDLNETIKQSLVKSQEADPPKSPTWQGCGCLLIFAIVVFSLLSMLIGYLFNKDEIDESMDDVRSEYLQDDIAKTRNNPDKKTDSLSFYIKTCVDISIEGIDMDQIRYYSKINEDKLLILLKVGDMKKIEPSSRKELVYAVQNCLDFITKDKKYQTYIGVDGKWNMLLVKTPQGSDLGGKFADSKLLLPFYDTKLKIKEKNQDTSTEVIEEEN